MTSGTISLIMATLVPIIAGVGVYMTQRTDEVDSFCLRFGVVSVVGAMVALFMHLGIPFVCSAFVCGAALLGYFFKLRQEMA